MISYLSWLRLPTASSNASAEHHRPRSIHSACGLHLCPIRKPPSPPSRLQNGACLANFGRADSSSCLLSQILHRSRPPGSTGLHAQQVSSGQKRWLQEARLTMPASFWLCWTRSSSSALSNREPYRSLEHHLRSRPKAARPAPDTQNLSRLVVMV